MWANPAWALLGSCDGSSHQVQGSVLTVLASVLLSVPHLTRSVWDPDFKLIAATRVVIYCSTGTQHTTPHIIVRLTQYPCYCMINQYSSSYSSLFTVLERQKSSRGGKTIKYINEYTVILSIHEGLVPGPTQTPQSTDAQAHS